MIKSFRTRLSIYAALLVLLVAQHIALMMTGYNASKHRGYFPSEERESMPLLEALTAEPVLLVYQVLLLAAIALILEAIIFLFRKK